MFCSILGCLLFLICIEFVYLYFPVLFRLSVSVKWLAAKTAFEMTYTVSSGALNSTPTNQARVKKHHAVYDAESDWAASRGWRACVRLDKALTGSLSRQIGRLDWTPRLTQALAVRSDFSIVAQSSHLVARVCGMKKKRQPLTHSLSVATSVM